MCIVDWHKDVASGQACLGFWIPFQAKPDPCLYYITKANQYHLHFKIPQKGVIQGKQGQSPRLDI